MEDLNHKNHKEGTLVDYIIFASILAGIVLISLIVYYFTAFGSPATNLMRIFMGVFFLVFGGFKFLDLDAFANSYVNYDLIAAKFRNYAYAYPFIELLLSLGYFLNLPGTNVATLIFMAIGSFGVGKQLLRGSKIQCACLGTFVKLPLTTVSLVENAAMGLMALMLVIF